MLSAPILEPTAARAASCRGVRRGEACRCCRRCPRGAAHRLYGFEHGKGDGARDNRGPRHGLRRQFRGGYAGGYGAVYGLPYGYVPYYDTGVATQPASASAGGETRYRRGILRPLITPRDAAVIVDGVLAGRVDDFGGTGEQALPAVDRVRIGSGLRACGVRRARAHWRHHLIAPGAEPVAGSSPRWGNPPHSNTARPTRPRPCARPSTPFLAAISGTRSPSPSRCLLAAASRTCACSHHSKNRRRATEIRPRFRTTNYRRHPVKHRQSATATDSHNSAWP